MLPTEAHPQSQNHTVIAIVAIVVIVVMAMVVLVIFSVFSCIYRRSDRQVYVWLITPVEPAIY